MKRTLLLLLIAVLVQGTACAQSSRPVAPPHVVNADSRLAKATRREQAGWIIVHLEGDGKTRGYQHGTLLASEIDDTIRTTKATFAEQKIPWATLREAAHRLFWDKTDQEYRDEMAGIAEGLQARGFRYDADDVLALNAHIEITGYYLPARQKKTTGVAVSRAPMACSAFVATGSATKDGKIVMGHNLWWDYLLGQRWRVLLDIQPTTGEHILMDALPGFIHSGSDFAVNSAGILITETTIGGFMGFDENGTAEFVRMRKAAQYSQSLEDVVRILKTGNNGGYANTWLLGDTKTGEIGKLELGLKNVTYSHTKDGAFSGANYPENPGLIAQECYPGSDTNISCVGRRARWQELLQSNKGQVDVTKAHAFLADTYDPVAQKRGATISTLCGRGDQDARINYYPSGAVNSKIVTSDSAAKMQIWARMGFSDGSTLSAKPYLAKHDALKWMMPYLRDIPAQPWVQVKVTR